MFFWKRKIKASERPPARGGRPTTNGAQTDVEMLQRFFAGCAAFDVTDPFNNQGHTVLPLLMRSAEAEKRDTS